MYDERQKSTEALCYIFGAGEHTPLLRQPTVSDLVIAADGGYRRLKELGIPAQLLVGDFDSLAERPQDVPTVTLPVDKDDTDMSAAVNEGWRRGYRSFHLYGGTGGRLDHTMANIQLLGAIAQKGGRALLFDATTVLTAITDSSLDFAAGQQGTVSVFSLSDLSHGVSLRGLKYPLQNATLRNTYPLGVSNEFTGKPVRISVKTGTLLIMYHRSKAR